MVAKWSLIRVISNGSLLCCANKMHSARVVRDLRVTAKAANARWAYSVLVRLAHGASSKMPVS